VGREYAAFFNPLFLNMDYSQRLQYENRIAEPG